MRFTNQSTRLMVLALAAVVAVLILSGIQAIARSNWENRLVRPLATSQFAEIPPLVSSVRVWDWKTLLQPASPSSDRPLQQYAAADPSNYGDRYTKDIYGRRVSNAPIVVLHETTSSAESALNTFQTPHDDEDDQVSYHSLIQRDGTIIYIVAPEKRAFGAGDSAFKSAQGVETVRTHHKFPSSVNNFAYHISLESPIDGYSDDPEHSGYTDEQYRSLAWLVACTGIPDDRITTHRTVDRSHSRFDPRSFDSDRFSLYLHGYPRPSAAVSSR